MTTSTGDVSASAAASTFSFCFDVPLVNATTRTSGHQRLACFCHAGITAFGQQIKTRKPAPR